MTIIIRIDFVALFLHASAQFDLDDAYSFGGSGLFYFYFYFFVVQQQQQQPRSTLNFTHLYVDGRPHHAQPLLVGLIMIVT